MKITFYGHSSILIETNNKSILVDPFISANPLAAHIDINKIHADYILLTHAHYDHVFDVEAIAANTGATIIANHEIVTYYGARNIKGHAMNHGGSWNFDFGKVKMVNAVHTSSFADGSNGGNPGGFVLTANEKSIYIAGDTALTMDMKLIPLFNKIDLAILPIGGNFTMDIEEAIYAARFVECNEVLGVHFDTADYIKIDHREAKQKMEDSGIALRLLEIGDYISI